MKYSALDYQKDGIRFIMNHPRCGVFADPGGGKTAITLAAFTLLRKHHLAKRALIIAPRLVCSDVWPAECEKWDQFKGLKCSFFHGEEKAQSLFQEVIDPKADICHINPEMVKYLLSFFPEKWFTRKSGPPINWPWDVLVVDESSKFKNPSTSRFKTLKRWHKLFNRRIILTGTPTPNSLQDIWSQIYILDSGAALGKNITEFRRNYFEYENNGSQFNKWVARPGAYDEVLKKIAPFVIRFDESMFAELPELIFNEMHLTLPDKALKYYKALERDFFAEMDDQKTFVDSASGKYLLCRQIANGRHYDPDDKSKIISVHDIKIEALKNLVDELQGKPLMVAYYFKHDLMAIREAFPNIKNIGSDSSAKQISENLNDWNAGRLPILAVHPGSMSHGLNMQSGGSHLFYFSLTNSLESFLQLNKRLHRRGAKNNIIVHLPIAKNTVDVAIMQALKSKTKNQNELLNALKEYRNTNISPDRFKI